MCSFFLQTIYSFTECTICYSRSSPSSCIFLYNSSASRQRRFLQNPEIMVVYDTTSGSTPLSVRLQNKSQASST
ncbi:hypothetical protein YC2023_106114 [Brassica napus]